MKIKNEQNLKDLYNLLIKNKPVNGKKKNCPKADTLIEAFSKERKEKEKLDIIDHITKCPTCLDIFNTIREFFKEGEKIAAKLDKGIVSNHEMTELKQAAKNNIKEIETKSLLTKKTDYKEKPELFFGRKWPVKYAALAAGILVLAVSIVLFMQTKEKNSRQILRGQSKEDVRLIAPKGEVSKSQIVFQWSSTSRSLKYKIVLLDEELSEVWLSNKTSTTTIKLPGNVFHKMKKGKIYFWKVIMYLKDKSIDESNLQEFNLKSQLRHIHRKDDRW
jgi:hypothetical protein